MRPLFDKEERVEQQETTMAELEERKTALMERLSELGDQQKELSRQVRALEKEQRKELEGVEEYITEEPLTHEDVERWARSVYLSFAHTMPGNPHMYAARKRCDSDMFTRVARYIQENGYPQRYGSKSYTCLDADLHDGSAFLWTMGNAPEETIIINAKPDALRPE